MLVREHIDSFTRGGDPYTKLGVGDNRPLKNDDQVELLRTLVRYRIDGRFNVNYEDDYKEKGDESVHLTRFPSGTKLTYVDGIFLNDDSTYNGSISTFLLGHREAYRRA